MGKGERNLTTGTKESILAAALHLFAREGYETASTSMIAGELGMTKGALYKHFSSKRDILDSIVKRMEAMDAEKAEAENVPAESAEAAPESYEKISPKVFAGYAKEMFAYWTEDSFASDFRKMLTLEQYRNPEMAALLNNYLYEGPLLYTAEVLERGMGLEPETAREKAARLCGIMTMYYTISDHAKDRAAVRAFVNRCIDGVFEE